MFPCRSELCSRYLVFPVGASCARDALAKMFKKSYTNLGLFSFRFLGMVFYQLVNISGFISFPIIRRWNIEKL